MDNLSANKTPAIRRWAGGANVELCFTPTNASWANPIEAQFGPIRTFVMGDSDHPNHTVLARKLQDYLRWRNANARHPGESGARHLPSVPVRAVWAIWEWTCSCMSPSREVCCSQCATARSASCHWPVSRPCTRVPCRAVPAVPGLALEVRKPGPDGLPDHGVNLGH